MSCVQQRGRQPPVFPIGQGADAPIFAIGQGADAPVFAIGQGADALVNVHKSQVHQEQGLPAINGLQNRPYTIHAI